MKPPLRVLVVTFLSEAVSEEFDMAAALETEDWHTEHDVMEALEQRGHEPRLLVLFDDIDVLRQAVEEFKPDIVFNLVDEFRGKSTNDYQVAAYLEARDLPYTGVCPAGLLIAKDKGLAKVILRHHRIRTADFVVYPVGRRIHRPARLQFPIIVKTLYEEGSVGISQRSVVNTDEEFRERVEWVHRSFKQPALAEEYIRGRELYCAVLGSDRLQVFPLREIRFGGMSDDTPQVASYRAKWDHAYRDRWKIENDFAKGLDESMVRKIERTCRRAARALKNDAYTRFDLRLTDQGEVYILEANPNPFLANHEDYAVSAEAGGVPYPTLIDRIVRLGFRRHERR